MNDSVPTLSLPWPLERFMGVRIIDAWGGGVYGSPRGDRHHKGLDMAAYPGEIVVSVFPESEITRIGRAYHDGSMRYKSSRNCTTFFKSPWPSTE